MTEDEWGYHTPFFISWIGMTSEGDGHYRGQVQESWEALSQYLVRHHANGSLEKEKLCGGPESDDDDDDDDDIEMFSSNATSVPLVLKIKIGTRPAKEKKLGKKLSRVSSTVLIKIYRSLTWIQLDVLKSMFDAFVNRLLAYNFQTHMGK